MATIEAVLNEIKNLTTTTKETKKVVDELKTGQQTITKELSDVKKQVGEVREDVEGLKKRNDDIEARLKVLEEGGPASSRNTYQWKEAVEYAKRVVVLDLPKEMENLPEETDARVKFVEEIFVNMGMTKKDLDRYKGKRIYQTDNGKANKNVNIEFEPQSGSVSQDIIWIRLNCFDE